MWQRVKQGSKWGVFLISSLLALLIFVHSWQYFNPVMVEMPFLWNKSDLFPIYLPALYGHICTSSFILIIGMIALSTTVRQRWLAVHKTLGKIYVGLILLVSAPCGFVMACCANGGYAVKLCFILLSVLWWYYTWSAWRTVVQGKIMEHERFMWQSYVLTFSAINLRVYTFCAAYFFEIADVDSYLYCAWLSWVGNLLVLEVYWAMRRDSAN